MKEGDDRTSQVCLRVRDASVDPILRAGNDLISGDLSRSSFDTALEIGWTIAIIPRVRDTSLGFAKRRLHASPTPMRSRAGSIIAALDIVTTRAKIPRVKCSSATTRRSRDAHTHCAARITSCLDRTPSGQPQGLIAYWGRSQVLSSGKRKEGKKRQNQHPKNVRYTRRPRSHEHLSDVNSNRISSAALAGKGTETSCIGKMTLGACSSLLFLSPGTATQQTPRA
jgi:hypothetical protein